MACKRHYLWMYIFYNGYLIFEDHTSVCFTRAFRSIAVTSGLAPGTTALDVVWGEINTTTDNQHQLHDAALRCQQCRLITACSVEETRLSKVLEDAPRCRGPKLQGRRASLAAGTRSLKKFIPPSTARSATQHHRIVSPSHSLPALFLHFIYPNMSFASPIPLKAVVPARIVSASRRCQRRNMSHVHVRAQLQRPSIAAQKPAQNVSPVRVSHFAHFDPPMPCIAENSLT
jgi:hypothetical protein